MREETKQRFKKSAKPAVIMLVWMVAFIFIAPKFEAWKETAIPALYFLSMAIAYGVPAFAAYRVMEPWLDYEAEKKEPKRKRKK